VPHLTERAARFPSDRAAFEALVDDPHLIVVDERFGDTDGVSGAGRGSVGPGTTVRADDPVSGRSTTYQVVGVMTRDVTGVGLGLLVSFQMLSRSAALGGEVMPYAVPWPTIGLLAVVPFLASLAVSLLPASQAASVDPAQVLRMAE
jgi:hypothetical protein